MQKKKVITGEEMIADELENLRKIAPNAVFFTLTNTNQNTIQIESVIPESVPQLVKKNYAQPDDVEMLLCSFFLLKFAEMSKKTQGDKHQ